MIGVVLAASALTVEAQQARQFINGLRAESGLGPVGSSTHLEQAAMAHAMDMVRNGFFGHDGSDGSTVGTRALRAGYDWCVIAENIAKGPNTQAEVLGLWARSPPHRRNMLRRGITEYGLVRAPGDIWVLVLGSAAC